VSYRTKFGSCALDGVNVHRTEKRVTTEVTVGASVQTLGIDVEDVRIGGQSNKYTDGAWIDWVL